MAILESIWTFLIGFLLFVLNIFTSLFLCIYMAIIASVQTFSDRCCLFFSFERNSLTYKILYSIYAIIFVIPFLTMLLTECIVLSAVFVVFKWIDKAFTPLALITGSIGGIIFLMCNYLFYFTTNLLTCTPNFLLSSNPPQRYIESSNL